MAYLHKVKAHGNLVFAVLVLAAGLHFSCTSDIESAEDILEKGDSSSSGGSLLNSSSSLFAGVSSSSVFNSSSSSSLPSGMSWCMISGNCTAVESEFCAISGTPVQSCADKICNGIGLFIDGNPETDDVPICNCGSGDGSSIPPMQCGSDIANNLHYYMLRRNGDRAGLDLDESNPYCSKSGAILTCYNGITIDTEKGTIKVEKTKVSGGGLLGTYIIYVEAAKNAWYPPIQVAELIIEI